MAISPQTVKVLLKALKLIGKFGPPILDTADKVAKAIKAHKKDLSAPKILEEEKIAETQEYDKVLEASVRALRQHVKVINRNSRVLSEQGKMIEDLTAQAQEHAIVLDAVSRLVHVLYPS